MYRPKTLEDRLLALEIRVHALEGYQPEDSATTGAVNEEEALKKWAEAQRIKEVVEQALAKAGEVSRIASSAINALWEGAQKKAK